MMPRPMRRRTDNTTIFPVAGRIDIPVPGVVDKVDWTSAGVVPVAVPVPIAAVLGRHAQINRLMSPACLPDDDRLRINQLWPVMVADVDLAVKPGIADAD